MHRFTCRLLLFTVIICFCCAHARTAVSSDNESTQSLQHFRARSDDELDPKSAPEYLLSIWYDSNATNKEQQARVIETMRQAALGLSRYHRLLRQDIAHEPTRGIFLKRFGPNAKAYADKLASGKALLELAFRYAKSQPGTLYISPSGFVDFTTDSRSTSLISDTLKGLHQSQAWIKIEVPITPRGTFHKIVDWIMWICAMLLVAAGFGGLTWPGLHETGVRKPLGELSSGQ